jgi:hypothetical protein
VRLLGPLEPFALTPHTRRFLWATIGVIVPLAILLVLFPRHSGVYWMWAMRDPRSALLVGTVYMGATVYYALALMSDDWLEAQAGLEGLFTVSTVLLVAVVLHWEAVRPWHVMTLVWMPAYYVPLLFVPYLFRLQGGWTRLPRSDLVQIPRGWAVWLVVRGLVYVAFAAVGFGVAGALARSWPWAIDPVEVRMFLGQPATFVAAALAALRGNLLWRRHRLHLVYVGSLGVVQLIGLLALPTPYRWASPLGVLLPLVFLEWIVTPLAVGGLVRRGVRARPHRGGAAGRPVGPAPLSAAQYGAMILGGVYVVIGLAGFLPVAAINPPRGAAVYLLRHIAVDGLHNLIHVAIGVTGLAAARRPALTQIWGTTVGTVLLGLCAGGVVDAALAGFPRDHALLGLLMLNSAGHALHLATGAVALIFGLAARVERGERADRDRRPGVPGD